LLVVYSKCKGELPLYLAVELERPFNKGTEGAVAPLDEESEGAVGTLDERIKPAVAPLIESTDSSLSSVTK